LIRSGRRPPIDRRLASVDRPADRVATQPRLGRSRARSARRRAQAPRPPGRHSRV